MWRSNQLVILAVILFCVGILCLAQSRADMPMTGVGMGAPSSGGFSPSCSQSSTFLAAATGYSLTADKTAIDTFICGGVTDGWFSKLDFFHMYAAPSRTNAALVNLIAPGTFNGTENGTISFAAYAGYTGDGSTFFIDTGFNPATASSPNFTTNSATFGYCGLSDAGSNTNNYTLGVSNATHAVLNPNNGGTIARWILNANAFANDSNTGSFTGNWTITTNSTTQHDYFNGTDSGGGVSATPTAVPNGNFYVFARDLVGTGASDFVITKEAAAFAGGLLSSTDAGNLHTRLNTYLTNYSHGGIC